MRLRVTTDRVRISHPVHSVLHEATLSGPAPAGPVPVLRGLKHGGGEHRAVTLLTCRACPRLEGIETRRRASGRPPGPPAGPVPVLRGLKRVGHEAQSKDNVPAGPVPVLRGLKRGRPRSRPAWMPTCRACPRLEGIETWRPVQPDPPCAAPAGPVPVLRGLKPVCSPVAETRVRPAGPVPVLRGLKPLTARRTGVHDRRTCRACPRLEGIETGTART